MGRFSTTVTLVPRRREHRRVLDADHPGADDHHRGRNGLEIQDAVGVEYPGIVEFDARGPQGLGARREDDEAPANGDALGPARVLDLQRVCVGEAGVSDVELDAVAHQLGADDVDLLADDVLSAGQEVGGGDLLLDAIARAVQLALAHPRQIDDRLAERLRRDGSGVHAYATEHQAAFDDGDRLAEFRSRDRGLLTAGTGPDDDEVVFLHGSHEEQVYAASADPACRARQHHVNDGPPSTEGVSSTAGPHLRAVGTISGRGCCEVLPMTTFRASDFDLNRPAAMIAALPAMLGFVPEKSLVLVTVEDGGPGCVMRVDLSAALPDDPRAPGRGGCGQLPRRRHRRHRRRGRGVVSHVPRRAAGAGCGPDGSTGRARSRLARHLRRRQIAGGWALAQRRHPPGCRNDRGPHVLAHGRCRGARRASRSMPDVPSWRRSSPSVTRSARKRCARTCCGPSTMATCGQTRMRVPTSSTR